MGDATTTNRIYTIHELDGLDEQGKAALLEALNAPGEDGTMGLDLAMQGLEKMIGELAQ